MDFTTLMNVATAKQKSKDKIKINRYSLELSAPKKESKEMSRSDAVKKLIQEKENEKQVKEKLQRDKEKTKQLEENVKELEEKKKSQFRIPKKKTEESKISVDKEKLINSLFEDDDDLEGDVGNSLNELNASSHLSLPGADSTHKSSSHSESHSHKHSSSHKSTSSSSSKDKSSHSHHESSKSRSNSSVSGDKKSHGSSSSSRSKSSSSHSKSSSSSSSSKHGSKSSSSSSSKHRSKSSSSSSSSTSKHKPSSNPLSSSSSKPSESKPLTSTSPSSAAEQPIALSKHHLKPVAERHAVPSAQLSEKEKILAKLAAIKQRTLDAIHKEQQGKGRRSRGEKSQSSSRISKAEKEDERVKSKEIVKDVYSSDEEGEGNKGMPSVIDIMLDEHQSKLERGKIARMAKQAWDRATKKGGDEDSISTQKKVRKMSRKPIQQVHKRRDHSLSPEPNSKKKPRPSNIEVKKPKIVRHAGNLAPPPPDFQAILAMAAQKIKDPPKPGGLSAIPKKKKKEEEARPMTQEEKERKERVKSKEYQQWLKYGGKHPGGGKENSNNSSADEEETHRKMSKNSHNSERNGTSKNHLKSSSRDTVVKRPSSGQQVGSGMKSNKAITVNENVLVCGPAEDGDAYDSEEDVRRGKGQQQQSINPFDRIYNSVHKKSGDQHAARKRRIEEEDEEEEESDLEGFIDDGEDEEKDYSKHIAKIFGYNKNRYVDEDDDLSDMEANFATVMAEEKRSAKIGLMEDLEDMKREEEELKRKAMLKKKMRR